MGRLCNHHEITVLDSRMSYTHRTDHPMHDGATAPVGVCNNFLLHDSTSLPIQHLAFDAPLPPSPLAGLRTGPRPRDCLPIRSQVCGLPKFGLADPGCPRILVSRRRGLPIESTRNCVLPHVTPTSTLLHSQRSQRRRNGIIQLRTSHSKQRHTLHIQVPRNLQQNLVRNRIKAWW
jgi:hypothetical protein